MKEIKTHIDINCPAELVWQVLMDFKQHPAWNPFIKSITGEVVPGKKIKVTLQPPGGGKMTFIPKVLVHNPVKEFRWKGKLFIYGIFDGEHYFIIESLQEELTRFVHGEKFSGFLVLFSEGMLEKTREGFEQMNVAIKTQCEGLHQASKTKQ